MKRLLCFIFALSLIFIACNVDPPQKVVNYDMEQVSEFIPVMDAVLPAQSGTMIAMETIYLHDYAEWSGGTLVIGKLNSCIAIFSSIYNNYNAYNGDLTRLNRQSCIKPDIMVHKENLNGNHPINPVARSGTFYSETIAWT